MKPYILIFFFFITCGAFAQNQPPVFIQPNYTDTALEAELDTCLSIVIDAPEANDSVVFWIEGDLISDDSNVYIPMQIDRAKGTLSTQLCFKNVCRKVRSEPYALQLYARDTAFDTTVYQLNIYFTNSLSQEMRTLPNVFTPNGDGINDEFKLRDSKAQCANLFSITVFNRWGQKVYENNRVSFSWDGGKSPDGVYFYIIEAGGDGVNGILNLIR